MREVNFFLNIAKLLKEKKYNISFISFFQPGNKLIKSNGFKCYDLYEYIKPLTNDSNVIFDYYDINNVHQLIQHEKLTFGIKSDNKLKNKFKKYLFATESIIQDLKNDNNIQKQIIFQELGGFIAPLSLYFVSKKNNIKHIFYEPSFFKSRLLFIEDKLSSHVVLEKQKEIKSEVLDYLNKLKKEKNIAIPDKDRHHFKDMSFSKIINGDNISKYSKKIYYKYVRLAKQEYDKISNHVIRNIKMFINRKRISKYYCELKDLQNSKYFFFPFHVPLDYALTIRSPKYLDQIQTIYKIVKYLPTNYKLALKEHPAGIGAYNKKTIKNLLEKCKNVKLLNPNINSHLVSENSEAIITINSKVGAEALVSSKTVISLGDSFYSNSSLINYIDDIVELKNMLHEVVFKKQINEKGNVKIFFQNLWDSTYPGELYNNDKKNINNFTMSTINFINDKYQRKPE